VRNVVNLNSGSETRIFRVREPLKDVNTTKKKLNNSNSEHRKLFMFSLEMWSRDRIAQGPPVRFQYQNSNFCTMVQSVPLNYLKYTTVQSFVRLCIFTEKIQRRTKLL
jgi:hypothetical protein